MHSSKYTKHIQQIDPDIEHMPLPEAKPVADYIHTDENGREYIIITHMTEKDGNYGLEQYRRYLEPLNEEDAQRTFIKFAKA